MKRIWKTKLGKKLKIKDMTTQHIKNCIDMLNDYHSAVLYSLCVFGNTLRGEGAETAFEDSIEDLLENSWTDKAEDYILSFKQELEKRSN